MIKVAEWCQVMSDVMQLQLPWRQLRPKLVKSSDNGLVEYHSTFEEFRIDSTSVQTVVYHFVSFMILIKSNDESLIRICCNVYFVPFSRMGTIIILFKSSVCISRIKAARLRCCTETKRTWKQFSGLLTLITQVKY